MLKAACCLALFGFLRCSEFTAKPGPLDPSQTLLVRDITFLPRFANCNCIKVFIKCSKTDPLRDGVYLHIYKTGVEAFAVQQLKIYLLIRQAYAQTDPLFMRTSGSPLTASPFISMVSTVLDLLHLTSSHHAGHSFRIGTAATAGAAGLQDWLIKTLGPPIPTRFTLEHPIPPYNLPQRPWQTFPPATITSSNPGDAPGLVAHLTRGCPRGNPARHGNSRLNLSFMP